MKLYALIKLAKEYPDKMLDLIQRFLPLIKKYAFLLKNEDAQYDLTLAFIEIIYKYPKNADNSQDKYILSYLKKSVRHAYIALSKKIAKNSHIYLEDVSNIEPTTIDNSKLEIIDFIKHLTKKQKDVIWLKYMCDYSNTEIAKLLNITRQAVNQIEKRAVNTLKYELEKNNEYL